MSRPTVGANPHASDATVDTAKPDEPRAPAAARSATFPNAGTKIERNRNGADTTQVIAASDVPKSRRMKGTAVVSAVTVSPLANRPAHTVTRTFQRYGTHGLPAPLPVDDAASRVTRPPACAWRAAHDRAPGARRGTTRPPPRSRARTRRRSRRCCGDRHRRHRLDPGDRADLRHHLLRRVAHAEILVRHVVGGDRHETRRRTYRGRSPPPRARRRRARPSPTPTRRRTLPSPRRTGRCRTARTAARPTRTATYPGDRGREREHQRADHHRERCLSDREPEHLLHEHRRDDVAAHVREVREPLRRDRRAVVAPAQQRRRDERCGDPALDPYERDEARRTAIAERRQEHRVRPAELAAELERTEAGDGGNREQSGASPVDRRDPVPRVVSGSTSAARTTARPRRAAPAPRRSRATRSRRRADHRPRARSRARRRPPATTSPSPWPARRAGTRA